MGNDVWCDIEVFYHGRIRRDVRGLKIKMENPRGCLSISADGGTPLRAPSCDECCAQVAARQNVKTGEVDLGSLRLVRLTEYKPGFDEDYLNSLQDRAAKSWDGVDVDKYIDDIRGTFE